MATTSFQSLIVWQKAHEFVLLVYKTTSTFPKEELFGLTSQFRRAAVSIPANIAEGYRRKSKLEKYRFFNISQASIEECRYYLILSQDLGYSSNLIALNLLDEVSKMLNTYSIKVTDSLNKSSEST
ncbi:MAG: four helix bundle protein [Bacteroidetes bacterium]|nr:four helix bundle protein [Bacteroidota bacterium]